LAYRSNISEPVIANSRFPANILKPSIFPREFLSYLVGVRQNLAVELDKSKRQQSSKMLKKLAGDAKI
jgi:hypothetical protein